MQCICSARFSDPRDLEIAQRNLTIGKSRGNLEIAQRNLTIGKSRRVISRSRSAILQSANRTRSGERSRSNIIPLEWKNQFRQGNITPSLNDYVSPVETFLMQGKTNTAKRYYERLIQNLAKPVSQVRWEENLGVTPLLWESFYVIPLQCTREVRLREFQYKLIHRIIGVKDHLFKMRIVNENSCSFCKKNAETIEHLFVECDYSQDFWKQFTTYLKEKIQKQIILTKLDILFGVSKGDSMINHMIILGKKHMFYRKRNNLLPSLDDFVSYLKNVIRLEKEIAQLNGNLEGFKRKWKEFSQIDI